MGDIDWWAEEQRSSAQRYLAERHSLMMAVLGRARRGQLAVDWRQTLTVDEVYGRTIRVEGPVLAARLTVEHWRFMTCVDGTAGLGTVLDVWVARGVRRLVRSGIGSGAGAHDRQAA